MNNLNLKGNLVFVYALIDPRDNEVRYVGSTTRPLQIRLMAHMHEGSGRAKVDWINELREVELMPSIVELERVTARSRLEAETKWAQHYLALGARLTNGKFTNVVTSETFAARRNRLLKDFCEALVKIEPLPIGPQHRPTMSTVIDRALEIATQALNEGFMNSENQDK